MYLSIGILLFICLIVYVLYRMSSAENGQFDKQEQKLQEKAQATTIGINDPRTNHIDHKTAPRALDSSWRSAPSARAAQERGSRAAVAKGRGWDYETKVDQHGHWWRLVASKGEVELSQPAGSKEQRSQLNSRLRLTASIWPQFDLTVQDGQYFMCSWVPFSHDGRRYARFCMESSDKVITEKDTELMYNKLCSAASATIRFAKPTSDDQFVNQQQ